MRLNSYVSGLGDGVADIIPDFGQYDSGIVEPMMNISTPSVDWGASIAYGTPSTSDPIASNSWSNLLQNVIRTGVNVGSQIAVTQNAVPQLAPGTTYQYNARTGSYVMTAAQPGTANVITSAGGSILSSPIILLALAGLGIVLIARRK